MSAIPIDLALRAELRRRRNESTKIIYNARCYVDTRGKSVPLWGYHPSAGCVIREKSTLAILTGIVGELQDDVVLLSVEGRDVSLLLASIVRFG